MPLLFQNHHQSEYQRYENIKKEKVYKNKSVSAGSNTKSKINFTQNQFDKFVVNFIADGMLALNIVDTDYFKKFVKSRY